MVRYSFLYCVTGRYQEQNFDNTGTRCLFFITISIIKNKNIFFDKWMNFLIENSHIDIQTYEYPRIQDDSLCFIDRNMDQIVLIKYN